MWEKFGNLKVGTLVYTTDGNRGEIVDIDLPESQQAKRYGIKLGKKTMYYWPHEICMTAIPAGGNNVS